MYLRSARSASKEAAEPWTGAGMMAPVMAAGTSGLRVHAGDEESIVADVFAQRALGIEGSCGAVDGVRGALHFFELFNGAACGIAEAVELIGLGELAEDARDVG